MSANFHPIVYIIDYILGIIMWTLVGRVAMIVVSLMTPAPNASTQKMVDEARVPAGSQVISQK